MTDQRFGNYRVVRKLGEGGMGTVFEVLHEEIGKRAAVKVLHARFSKDPLTSARFLTEARAVNMVQHPGLVSIFEFGKSPDGAAYLVMEFLEGETLSARLQRAVRLPVEEARRITRQVAGALAAAHDKRVVHRDLKPENVMLIPEPDLPGGERAKILDFGVAKVARTGAAAATQAGAFLGTPAYMAPEQCMSAGDVDEKADVYALGVMLYENRRAVCSPVRAFPGASHRLAARGAGVGNGLAESVRASGAHTGRARRRNASWHAAIPARATIRKGARAGRAGQRPGSRTQSRSRPAAAGAGRRRPRR